MSSDDPITEDDLKAVEAFSKYLANEDMAITNTLTLMFGVIPSWVPAPKITEAQIMIQGLFNIGLSEKEIAECVSEAVNDALTYPGHVINTSHFETGIYWLADFVNKVSLGPDVGLGFLGGVDAVRGRKVLSGATRGHEGTHGSKSEKLAIIQKIKNQCKEIKSRNPALGITEIRRKVATDMKLSTKTIQRHTLDWKEWLTT